MDFRLNKEQETIKRMVKQFAGSRIAPVAAWVDEEGRIPPEIVSEMKKMKLFGVPYDKKYGGSGETFFELVLVLEELARVSSGVTTLVVAHYLPCTAIYLHGTEDQKLKYLPRLCSGEGIGSLAFTEAVTGSDPKAITTTAQIVGDEYILNGSKRFITNGALDGTAVLFARTGDGVSAFIVNKNQEGYTTSTPWEKMGCRGAGVVDVYLKDVRVPKENLLGQEGDGYKILLKTIAMGKLNVSALLLGLGGAALEEAARYARERTSRGKPIAALLSIQSLIAEAATRVEASRWLLYRAAHLAGQGKDNIEYESALAKLFISEAMIEAVHKSLQVHGSYGYVKEFKIERLYRDVRLGEVIEGASEIQRVMVAGNILR